MDNTDPNNPNSGITAPAAPPPNPPPNPWDTPAAPVPDLGMSQAMNPMSPPAEPPAPAPQADSPWPSSVSQPAQEAGTQTPQASVNDTIVNAPAQGDTPMASNPFLQPQSSPAAPPPTDPNVFAQPASTPQIDLSQPASPDNSSQAPAAPQSVPESPFPSIPAQTPAQDPLNTAFSPTPNPNEVNLFNSTPAASTPAVTTPEMPGQSTLNPTPLPDFLNPGAQPPAQPQTTADNPATDTQTPPVPDTNPPPAPEQPSDNPQIPGTNQPGTLDLSALQANQPPAPNDGSTQPGNPLPESGPVENAPTDLSHLIAGEETNQMPADIYNPPVASDQNPSLNSTQAQAPSGDGGPPAEKHLNLTKVLLVAGIPIILIVVALSAYIFLGVGKPAPETSLPIEQTEPAQAPLTNPPAQIVAPSPVTIAEPSPEVESSPSASPSPEGSASPTSALERLKARQSSSSPSPTPSPTTSTDLN